MRTTPLDTTRNVRNSVAISTQLGASEFVSALRTGGTALRLLVLVFLIALFSINIWAGVDGTIAGTVKDPSNAVVRNAIVKATNINTGVQQQVTTNDVGCYSFPNLPVGRYDIVIQKAGF